MSFKDQNNSKTDQNSEKSQILSDAQMKTRCEATGASYDDYTKAKQSGNKENLEAFNKKVAEMYAVHCQGKDSKVKSDNKDKPEAKKAKKNFGDVKDMDLYEQSFKEDVPGGDYIERCFQEMSNSLNALIKSMGESTAFYKHKFESGDEVPEENEKDSKTDDKPQEKDDINNIKTNQAQEAQAQREKYKQPRGNRPEMKKPSNENVQLENNVAQASQVKNQTIQVAESAKMASSM